MEMHPLNGPIALFQTLLATTTPMIGETHVLQVSIDVDSQEIESASSFQLTLVFICSLKVGMLTAGMIVWPPVVPALLALLSAPIQVGMVVVLDSTNPTLTNTARKLVANVKVNYNRNGTLKKAFRITEIRKQ